MSSDAHPGFPDCPDCHGSGQKVLSGVFLDRVDEVTVPCPVCAERARREKEAKGRAVPTPSR